MQVCLKIIKKMHWQLIKKKKQRIKLKKKLSYKKIKKITIISQKKVSAHSRQHTKYTGQVMRLDNLIERKIKKNHEIKFFKKPSLAYKTRDASHLNRGIKYEKKNHKTQFLTN